MRYQACRHKFRIKSEQNRKTEGNYEKLLCPIREKPTSESDRTTLSHGRSVYAEVRELQITHSIENN